MTVWLADAAFLVRQRFRFRGADQSDRKALISAATGAGSSICR